MIPSVHLEYFLVIPCKRARLLSLPEDTRTCPNEVVVEEALMEGTLPSLAVQGFQGFPGGSGHA
jgi:hypothetical protein